MTQLYALEQRVLGPRAVCRDHIWKWILDVLVPIRGERAESLELSDGLEPHADVGTMLSDFMVVRPREAECLIGTPTELPQIG